MSDENSGNGNASGGKRRKSKSGKSQELEDSQGEDLNLF
jgi:hypothetical protein